MNVGPGGRCVMSERHMFNIVSFLFLGGSRGCLHQSRSADDVKEEIFQTLVGNLQQPPSKTLDSVRAEINVFNVHAC